MAWCYGHKITWSMYMKMNMVIKLIGMEKDQSREDQGKGILDRVFGLVIKTP